MAKQMARVASFVLVGALVAGCATRVPRVADLRSNPTRYYDKTVSVEGTVTSAWGIPLLPMQVYRIDDGSGEVTVVSQNGRAPTRGARVRVTGKVAELAVLGGKPLGLHLQEHKVSVVN